MLTHNADNFALVQEPRQQILPRLGAPVETLNVKLNQSFINTLLGQKPGHARTSGKPGKTQFMGYHNNGWEVKAAGLLGQN